MRHLPKLVLLLALVACQSGNAETEHPAPATAETRVAGSEANRAAKSESPRVIGQGALVDLVAERDPDRFTVYDFTSEYCGPCRRIAPYLDRLHAGREDVSVVKVDINRPGVRGIDWASPTVRQFGILSIPHMKVMDQAGTLIAEGEPAWNLVVKWIMEQEQPNSGR